MEAFRVRSLTQPLASGGDYLDIWFPVGAYASIALPSSFFFKSTLTIVARETGWIARDLADDIGFGVCMLAFGVLLLAASKIWSLRRAARRACVAHADRVCPACLYPCPSLAAVAIPCTECGRLLTLPGVLEFWRLEFPKLSHPDPSATTEDRR